MDLYFELTSAVKSGEVCEKNTRDETRLARHRNRIDMKLTVGRSLYKCMCLPCTLSVTPDCCYLPAGISSSHLVFFFFFSPCSSLPQQEKIKSNQLFLAEFCQSECMYPKYSWLLTDQQSPCSWPVAPPAQPEAVWWEWGTAPSREWEWAVLWQNYLPKG